MNTMLKFEKPVSSFTEVLKHVTHGTNFGTEFDVTKRLERISIRCGPYDNSDLLVIEEDQETHEIRVLFYDGQGPEEPECVFSVLEEQP